MGQHVSSSTRSPVCIYSDPCYVTTTQQCSSDFVLSEIDLSDETLYIITIINTVLYGLLFCFIYLQFLLILCFKHKKFSYRTFLLFLCITWVILRTVLYTWYWAGDKWMKADLITTGLAAQSTTFVYWLLFSCPVCIQFFILCILVCYFSQVVFRSEVTYNRYDWRKITRKYMCVFLAMLFLLVSVIVAVKVKSTPMNQVPLCDINRTVNSVDNSYHDDISTLIELRIAITGCMFLFMALALGVCIIRLSIKTNNAKMILETEGLTLCSAVLIGFFIVLLYVIRTVYNVLALLPCINWIYDTDQLELLCDQSYGYFSYSIMILIFEYIPTCVLVTFFRVKPLRTTEGYNIFHFPAAPNFMRNITDDDEDSLPALQSSSSTYGTNVQSPSSNEYSALYTNRYEGVDQVERAYSTSHSFHDNQVGFPEVSPDIVE